MLSLTVAQKLTVRICRWAFFVQEFAEGCSVRIFLCRSYPNLFFKRCSWTDWSFHGARTETRYRSRVVGVGESSKRSRCFVVGGPTLISTAMWQRWCVTADRGEASLPQASDLGVLDSFSECCANLVREADCDYATDEPMNQTVLKTKLMEIKYACRRADVVVPRLK